MKSVALVVSVIIWGVMAGSVASANTLVLQFFGEGGADQLSTATNKRVWDLAHENEIDLNGFNCFEIELRNPAGGYRIGTGVDCLRIDNIADDADFIELSAHSFFLMPGKNAFIASGFTTVRAFRDGVGNGDRGDGAGPISHMTGSLPDGYNITGGSGDFSDATGSVRLSGAVDLSDFGNGNIFFNCLWVVELDQHKHSRRHHHKRRHHDDDD